MTPGQAAFEAWVSLVGYPLGWPFSDWGQLPSGAQEGWERIASVALETHRGLNACSCNRPNIDPEGKAADVGG